MREVYLDRDEMVEAMASRVRVVSDLGAMLKGIEGLFVLHDNDDAEVYIFEIDLDSECMSGSVHFLSALMDEMNISAVFVPMGAMRYLGTVTAESMGVAESVAQKRSLIKSGIEMLRKIAGKDDGDVG